MTEATIRADRLRVEYLKDPIGIDCLQPEIQWLPTGAGAQTAFRVVERDPAGTILSDSGKILSRSTVYRPANKKNSRARVTVEVRLWDERDREGPVQCARYELGLTEPSDFCARWIDPELSKRRGLGASYLRKRFSLDSTENARLPDHL